MHQPTKERVRAWLDDQVTQHKPPPDPKQIRRELGWDLIEAERHVMRIGDPGSDQGSMD